MSLARQLRTPLFVTKLDISGAVPADLDLANELLAEAQFAIFRRMPRLAVINSFTALETLANSVFKRERRQQLIGWGVPEHEAEAIAENERRANRTREKFLLGAGISHACSRSLLLENKTLYDEILRLEEKVRHGVVHKGTQPAIIEAKAAFRACCKGVRWLCDVAGYPKKEMVPPPDEVVPGFGAGSQDPFVCGPAEMEVLRRMFRIVLPSGDP